MKIQAIYYTMTQILKAQLLLWMFVLLSVPITDISAQSINKIGIEYGGIMIGKISSSGVQGATYSFSIFSESEVNEHWSFGYGIKYLKYANHIYYKPNWNLTTTLSETLVEKQHYTIQNLGVCFFGKYRIKNVGLFLGIQPEKAMFNDVVISHKVIPARDIKNENYPQSDLRTFNVSVIGGLELKRKFGDRLEFFTKPSVQYLLKPFYVHDGFNDTRYAFHLTFGLNYVLTVLADE